MMRDGMMMENMGPMMWGMGLFGLVGLILVALVIAALIKHLFFGRSRRTGNE
jgi:hypothetical protein